MGEDGVNTAANIAKKSGGVTLETIIESQGINMPEWIFNDSDTIQAWKNASATYARQASGEVRAVLGYKVSSNSIWFTEELPELKANPNVNKIIVIDPITLTETIIFTR